MSDQHDGRATLIKQARRFQGSAFRIQGSGFRVQGSGLRV